MEKSDYAKQIILRQVLYERFYVFPLCNMTSFPIQKNSSKTFFNLNINKHSKLIIKSFYKPLYTRYYIKLLQKMFSLTDELRKFQKSAYSKDLESLITIDDKFLGGGVTIHDLIKQNNFMITELRKMKDVFINYCQLNDKMYQKIIEHQLSIAGQENKFKQIVHSMHNKIQESLVTMNQLQEDTKIQNTKSETLFRQAFGPVKEQLTGKVDHTVLEPLVRLIIDKYDSSVQSNDVMSVNGDASQQEFDVQGKIVQKENLLLNTGPTKKRKNAASQELNAFKIELVETIATLNSKIQQTKADLLIESVKLLGTETLTTELKIDIEYARDSITTIKTNQDDQTRYISTVNENLMREITSRTNDSVWNSRLSDFNDTFVEKPINRLRMELATSNSVIWKKFQEFPLKFQNLSTRIYEVASEIPPLQQSIPTLQLQIDHNRDRIREVDKDRKEAEENLSRRLRDMYQAFERQIEMVSGNQKRQGQELRLRIINSSNQIEAKVSKGVKSKFGGDLRDIACNIRNQDLRLEKATGRLSAAEAKIEHLKDIVSKKANFTDLLLESQKKVSRSQIKELKDRIQTETRPNLNNSQIFRSRQLYQRPSRKSMLSSRHLATPPSKNLEDDDNSPTRLFMCGFQEIELREVKDKKVVVKTARSKKNKSLRPTTANTMGVFDRTS